MFYFNLTLRHLGWFGNFPAKIIVLTNIQTNTRIIRLLIYTHFTAGNELLVRAADVNPQKSYAA